MAVISKKDKLIEDAQKLAQRGQFDKAAKAYEQILELEPSAINQRQKLAELLIKCGRHDDARKEFDTLGKYFSKNGFYLKAIAVYKQLQKLFPADISLSLTLAELNEKHGLIANSLSEYKLVYEFHENAGNIPEALTILDRMQTIDPQNIPVKIKLAEAYIQQGKTNEAYSLFAKSASMLLERADNAALSRVCARIQQLFPGKQDFMTDLLDEQISRGHAAIAMDNLQSLLRNNPNNKRTWDLVIQAYKQLGQPQRVKIAYQHYLNFFPSEPAALLGLITTFAEEHDLAKAVELLDQHESALISAGFLRELEQLYLTLDKIDPINIRIVEGLIRVATAVGNENEVRSLTSKLESLHSISGGVRIDSAQAESPPVFFEEYLSGALEKHEPSPSINDISAQTTVLEVFSPEVERSLETASDATDIDAVFNAPFPSGEDIDIEIEIDIDSPFGSPDQESETTPAIENSLDSVSDLFDTISTAPRGVKFGNEMDSSDSQSHFDLGQAFREMGLYDEAINEFRQASQEPARRVECLIMQCACLRERGEVEKAITILQTLLRPCLSVEENCAVKYELANGYEITGKKEEAHLLLAEINAANPGFRDISSRLVTANILDSLDFSDDDLKDF